MNNNILSTLKHTSIHQNQSFFFSTAYNMYLLRRKCSKTILFFPFLVTIFISVTYMKACAVFIFSVFVSFMLFHFYESIKCLTLALHWSMCMCLWTRECPKTWKFDVNGWNIIKFYLMIFLILCSFFFFCCVFVFAFVLWKRTSDNVERKNVIRMEY